METQALERTAVRMLCLLYYCGESNQMRLPFADEDDYTHSIDSEGRLQKLDFWLRYPDHLAAALLRCTEPDWSLYDQADTVKLVVQEIFANEEPDLRHIAMRKYLHGAYEPLDEVMCFLSSRRLATRRAERHSKRTRYYLMQKGHAVVERMVQTCSEITWYVDRCMLIQRFFGALDGFDIRKMQYLEPEYTDTPLLATIQRIDDLVCTRFAQRFGEPLC